MRMPGASGAHRLPILRNFKMDPHKSNRCANKLSRVVSCCWGTLLRNGHLGRTSKPGQGCQSDRRAKGRIATGSDNHGRRKTGPAQEWDPGPAFFPLTLEVVWMPSFIPLMAQYVMLMAWATIDSGPDAKRDPPTTRSWDPTGSHFSTQSWFVERLDVPSSAHSTRIAWALSSD